MALKTYSKRKKIYIHVYSNSMTLKESILKKCLITHNYKFFNKFPMNILISVPGHVKDLI